MPFDVPRFSETWNNTNPAWDYMSELTDYVSRLQTALQYGKAKVDFAVYRDNLGIRTDEGNTKGVLYLDEKAVPSENAATAVGYSYNYLSPSSFKLENGVVENGILNPDDAGYQALVINNETDMELADAQQILTYAKEGLSVVLVGQTPVTDGNHGAEDDEAVQAVFTELRTMANVAVKLSGPADATPAAKSLTYQIGVAGAEKLATATLHISVDNLKNPVAEALNGWYIIAQKETDGVLQVLLANNEGLSGAGDLLAVTGETTGKTGAAGLTVTKAVLSSYLDEREIFVNADLNGASMRTEIAYSTYDVNQDGSVDQLDITRAQRAYGASEGEDRWNALADVNRDDTVDINDLILILNHYGE